VNLSQAVESFIADRKSRDCGVHAIRAYRQHCGLFVAWLDDLKISDTSQLTSELFTQYLESMRERNQLRRVGKLSPVTLHKRMKHLRTFVIWLSHAGHIPKDTDLSFPMPKNRQRLPKALSPEQARKIISVKMSERDKAVLYLMLNSGLRISEVTALTLDDLDLVRGRVHVRHGKGDKERYSLFGPTTADCLRAWLAVRVSTSSFLFVDKWGRHLTISGVYKIVKRVSRSVSVIQ
jgi:integrase/recombinase XerC